MTPHPAILAADTNDRNLQLLAQFLNRAGCAVTCTTSLSELDAALAQAGAGYALALIDLSGFDEQIWARCDRLNQRQIPWLGLCLPHQEQTVQQQSYRRGARGILVKPLSMEHLFHAVRGILETAA